MNDTIYRQDAINTLSNALKGVFVEYEDVAEKILGKVPSAQPEQRWIPCSERMPDEDYWLGGLGKQFSSNVLVSIVNPSDEDSWVDISHTIDGEWALELPRYCKILAWTYLPEPYRGE